MAYVIPHCCTTESGREDRIFKAEVQLKAIVAYVPPDRK
jgi:hypothetical protein